MTISIAGRCARTGMLGMAISSSSPAVAARCAHARAGVGVVATQNITDPRLGPRGLDFLAQGLDAASALATLVASTPHAAFRQLVVLDAQGRAAVHSGERTLGLNRTVIGKDAAAAGNLLANTDVPPAMVASFEASTADLPARLLAALRAGVDAGGEQGPVRSAGLYVVRDVAWPVVDLRVDWSDGDPIDDLARVWAVYAPQVEDYVQRALNPTGAPSFGVPGDP